MKNPYLELDDSTLIRTFVLVRAATKAKKLIRSNNITGDRGENEAIVFYNSNPELPNLCELKSGTKFVDAVNINNERYSIKAITVKKKNTSVFCGLNPPDSKLVQEQVFEYVIIVMFNDEYQLRGIYELNWENFLEFRKWNKSKNAWFLYASKELVKNTKILYEYKEV